jgi:hypothetical protein
MYRVLCKTIFQLVTYLKGQKRKIFHSHFFIKSTHLGPRFISKFFFFKFSSKFEELFESKFDSPLHDAAGSQIYPLYYAEGVKSRRCILQWGEISLRCMMQRGFKSMIFAEIFPLHHAARSQIFLLHFAAGRCDPLLHLALGSQFLELQKALGIGRENSR